MGEDTKLSIAHGRPLAEETGIGPLTIGGYLREVVRRHGPAEAMVLRSGELRLSWSYDELLARSLEVARALIACELGKEGRVGILMTNRPEFLAALFGISLAGGVPVALSTFSTAPELDYMLKASQISVLLFESQVLKTDFHAMLVGLDPGIAQGAPGGLNSEKFPFLGRLISLGGVPGGSDPLEPEPEQGGAVGGWSSFIARGCHVSDAQVYARADSVVPSDTGGASSWSGCVRSKVARSGGCTAAASGKTSSMPRDLMHRKHMPPRVGNPLRTRSNR